MVINISNGVNLRRIYPIIFGTVLCLTVAFFAAVPLQNANAGLPEDIGRAVSGVLFQTGLMLFALLTNIILAFAVTVLNWAASPAAVSLPYTTGGIVGIGWAITRDLANMFLVMILIIIGLSTILRWREYQAQRTLPAFIAIALLINFTPVLIGLIIDASNIAMNFFLSGFSGGGGFDILQRSIGNLNTNTTNKLGTQDFWGTFGSPNILMELAVQNIFNLVASLMMLMFAGLFIARYIALWILVILSPLAFVAYILPATKSWFSQWWTQLTQWCMVGVTGAFFLYLSGQLMVMTFGRGGTGFVAPVPPNLQFGMSGMLNQILPYIVVIALLMIGFFTALQTGAMGARAVMSNVQRIGTGVGKGVAGAATRRGRKRAQEAAGEAAKGLADKEAGEKAAEKWKNRFAKSPVFGKQLGWMAGKTVAGSRAAIRLTAGKPLAKYAAQALKSPDEAYDEASKMTGEQIQSREEFATPEERIGLYAAWNKNNPESLKDAMARDENLEKRVKQATRKTKEEKRLSHFFNPLMAIDPAKFATEFSDEIRTFTDEQKGAGKTQQQIEDNPEYKELRKKAIGDVIASPRFDVGNLDQITLKRDEELRAAIVERKGGEALETIAKKFDQATVSLMQETAEKLTFETEKDAEGNFVKFKTDQAKKRILRTDAEGLLAKNPRILNYLRNTGAQALGYHHLEGLKEPENIVEKSRPAQEARIRFERDRENRIKKKIQTESWNPNNPKQFMELFKGTGLADSHARTLRQKDVWEAIKHPEWFFAPDKAPTPKEIVTVKDALGKFSEEMAKETRKQMFKKREAGGPPPPRETTEEREAREAREGWGTTMAGGGARRETTEEREAREAREGWGAVTSRDRGPTRGETDEEREAREGWEAAMGRGGPPPPAPPGPTPTPPPPGPTPGGTTQPPTSGGAGGGDATGGEAEAMKKAAEKAKERAKRLEELAQEHERALRGLTEETKKTTGIIKKHGEVEEEGAEQSRKLAEESKKAGEKQITGLEESAREHNQEAQSAKDITEKLQEAGEKAIGSLSPIAQGPGQEAQAPPKTARPKLTPQDKADIKSKLSNAREILKDLLKNPNENSEMINEYKDEIEFWKKRLNE